jgi:hypothetical protein
MCLAVKYVFYEIAYKSVPFSLQQFRKSIFSFFPCSKSFYAIKYNQSRRRIFRTAINNDYNEKLFEVNRNITNILSLFIRPFIL